MEHPNEKQDFDIIDMAKRPTFLIGALATGLVIQWLSTTTSGPVGIEGFFVSLIIFIIITTVVEQLYTLITKNKL